MICVMQNRYLVGIPMELRHLRYIIAVAEEGHITRAAERLGMQQPPLSRAIRAIERDLDVQLFRRKPRGVELTDAGRAFLDGARAMFANLDNTVEITRRTARGEEGRISVGYTSAAAFHPLVPRVIREFRRDFRLVSVTLTEDFPYNLVERLQSNRIDVAFVRTRIPDPADVAVDVLLEETMVVALPNGHALARSGKGDGAAISLRALAGESFIIYGRPQGTLTLQSDAIVAACQAAGFRPSVGQVVPHFLSTLNLVAAGLGIAVVSSSLQRMNIEGVTYRRLKGAAQLRVPLGIASRRGDTPAVVRQFLKLARRTASDYSLDSGK
jgi:DNA-binding transcriptional LysR family regulator